MTMKTMLAAAIMTALVAPGAAHAAETIGNPAVAGTSVDGASGQTFILNQAFANVGEQVTGYSFYASRAGTLTPLLFARTDNGGTATFTVIGRGTTQTVGVGLASLAFGLVSGSDITTAASYFGFADAALGVVSYQRGVAGANAYITEFSTANTPGSSYSFDSATVTNSPMSGLSNRIYSLNASAVPEPASWAMMLAGVGMIGFALRRRAKVSAAVHFA